MLPGCAFDTAACRQSTHVVTSPRPLQTPAWCNSSSADQSGGSAIAYGAVRRVFFRWRSLVCAAKNVKLRHSARFPKCLQAVHERYE